LATTSTRRPWEVASVYRFLIVAPLDCGIDREQTIRA